MVTFDEIIDNVSDEQLMTDYQLLRSSELKEKETEKLSEDTQKFYLSYYARLLYEHVGFSSFSQQNQDEFKKNVETLYNSIDGERDMRSFIVEMGATLSQNIEDRHCGIMPWEQGMNMGLRHEPGSVGGNLFHKNNEDRPDGYETISSSKNFENSQYQWEIGTVKNGNEDILVVSIPNLPMDNSYETSKNFIEAFDDVYLKNKEKWDNGRVILDVRGNMGGEDKPIDHVAKRLYGGQTNSYKRCEMKDTELSNWMLHKHGAYKQANYEKDGIKPQDLVQRKHFSNENKVMFDETEIYYDFNETSGYKGKIDVLIDRNVASSAESAYTSFYHHPNTRFVGENTSGTQCYTQGTFAGPWGGDIRIGVTKLTYWDKEGQDIEVKGHAPDVYCKGENALNKALNMNVDEGRVIGFRDKNEEITGVRLVKDYNPQDIADPRKAYYARYLDPAIKEIERKNIVQETLNRLSKTIGKSKNLHNESNSPNMLLYNAIRNKEM